MLLTTEKVEKKKNLIKNIKHAKKPKRKKKTQKAVA